MVIDELAGHVHRQPGLATPPRAREGDQALVMHERRDRLQLDAAADEAGGGRRQVVRRRLERAQSGEVAAQFRVRELPHTLGARQVPQSGQAQVDERRALGQVVEHQCGGRFGDEHLAAMTAGPQPCAPDDGTADVVALVTQLRFTGVDGHAYRQPVELLVQLPLCIERGPQRVLRCGERGDDGVALALLHRPHTTCCAHGGVQDLVVAGDRSGRFVLIRLPQTRRALNVGQQERDGPDR